jgi:hypothetical protein
VVKLTQLWERTRKLNDVTRAARIHAHRDILRNGEIVNCREMKDARRLLLDQLEIRGTEGESGHADIAFDDLKVTQASAGEFSDTLDRFERARHEWRLDEQDKIAVLAREACQQAVGDETGKPGYE